MQIKSEVAAQNAASGLRYFFDRPDVVEALNRSRLVHFARVLLIPNHREVLGTDGIFAAQVIVVYDGELDALLQYFWDEPALRSLFQTISDIAKVPASSPLDVSSFKGFITGNNLNTKPKELRPAYDLTVDEIINAFSQSQI